MCCDVVYSMAGCDVVCVAGYDVWYGVVKRGVILCGDWDVVWLCMVWLGVMLDMVWLVVACMV